MHFQQMQETVSLYFCGRGKKKTSQEQRLAKSRRDSASYRVNMRGGVRVPCTPYGFDKFKRLHDKTAFKEKSL